MKKKEAPKRDMKEVKMAKKAVKKKVVKKKAK